MNTLFRAALLTTAVLSSPPATAKAQSASTVRPLAYRLDLTILPDQPRFTGHVEIDVDLPKASDSLSLDGQGLRVTRAVLRQAGAETPATYRETDGDGHARVELQKTGLAGRATLVLDYQASVGDSLAGLYRLDIDHRWYVWSHLETKYARRVFPGFDRPGNKTPFTVSITTHPGLVVASNAAERSQAPAGALVRHVFATTEPLPTYLLAFAVGPFASSTTIVAPDAQRRTELPLRILAPQKAGDATLALTQTGPILRQLEAYMGRSYPYAKLDQIASPLMVGAMENAGAIIYDQSELLPSDPDSAASRSAFVRDVSHELAHQWFGDLVTPKSWNDLWLNESFANWMSYRIGDRWRPELHIGAQLPEEAVKALDQDELSASHPVHQLAGDDGEPFFDDITYGKGGQVLAMIEAYMGEDAFRSGLQHYLSRYADRNADTNDFFEALADTVHDPRILPALRSFVDQPGVPLIRFDRTPTGYRLSQSRYARLGATLKPERWTVPICYRADSARACIMLDETRANIPALNARVLMPNAGGTGYYRFALPRDEWRALIGTSASLTPAEALMMTDSLWAGFTSGEIAPDLLLEAARRMAENPFGPAAIDPGRRLAAMWHQGIIPPDQQAGYRRRLTSIYKPLLDRIGMDANGIEPGDTPEQQQLRIGLERLLADDASDPDVRAVLSKAAEASMNGHPEALGVGLEISGYAAFIAADPAAHVPAMFERMTSSKDRTEREILAYALGSGREQTQAAWLLDRLGDPRLSPLDRWHVLFDLTGNPGSRGIALPWAATHLDLLKGGSWDNIIGLADRACSLDDARMWADAIRPHIAGNADDQLTLDATLEKIHNCAALRDRRGRDIAAVLGRT